MLSDIWKPKVRIENGSVRFPMNRLLPLLLAGATVYLVHLMFSGELVVRSGRKRVPTFLLVAAYLVMTVMCTETIELTPKQIIVRYLGIRWKKVWWSQIGFAWLLSDKGRRGMKYCLRLYYDRTTEDELRTADGDTSLMQSEGYISLRIPADQLEEVVEAINALLPEHIEPVRIPETWS